MRLSRASCGLHGWLLVLAACHGEQQLKDDCPTAGQACPACTTDDDCVIASNPCQESAVCTHRRRDPPLSVSQEGCSDSLEYARPPADRCGCVEGVCRTR